MDWALYCRVIDNFGDIGVGWRLAADLAGRGEHVRLFVDDASALAWMAPEGAFGVEVGHWNDARATEADVVVELFGGGVPDRVAESIANASHPPVSVNLEHLTAEGYARRSHRLPSPRPAAQGRLTTTWFFYPGFEEGSGGLLREPGLLTQRASFDADTWLASMNIEARREERRVSLFGYANPALGPLVDALAASPTLLLLAPGAASEAAEALLGPKLQRGRLRAIRLPFVSQAGFDRLLWSCDLNLVRGEDSFVRSLWAGVPFVWQLYPQRDGAHRAKLEAFLGMFLRAASPSLSEPMHRVFKAWNGADGTHAFELLNEPAIARAWLRHSSEWCRNQATLPDLTTQLIGFAASRR